MDEHDSDGAPTSNEAPEPPVHKERTAKDTALILDQLQQEHLRGIAKRSEAEKAAKEKAIGDAQAAELAAAEERVRDELIAEIIAASGRSNCLASTKKTLGYHSHYSDQGELPQPLQHQLRAKSQKLIGDEPNRARSKAGVFEMVSIQPLTVIDKVQKTEVVPNNGISRWFGKPEVERTTSEDEERPVRNDEVYAAGHSRLSMPQEQMVLFRYLAKQPDSTSFAANTNDRAKTAYRDFTGERFGNYFLLNVTLPESKARALADQIRTSPGFARRLVEAFVETRFNSDATRHISKEWTDSVNPLRPPYEAWDEYATEHDPDGKRRLCFIDALNEPGVDPLDPKAVATHILQY